MNHVISLDDVQVLREGKAILGPLSWSVVEGERWVVLGPNGAGKTTLFHLISTFMHPTFGQVKMLDQTL